MGVLVQVHTLGAEATPYYAPKVETSSIPQLTVVRPDVSQRTFRSDHGDKVLTS